MTDKTYTLPNGSERSEQLHKEAVEVFPGGVSHNIRYFDPYPIFVERAHNSRLWDADGNEYVDFWMNHMASVLGHSHPDIVTTVQQQVEKGLHWGAVNEKALELGRRVQDYVPSAERVRFCASGTEATMYAVRLGRAFTGRDHVLKVQGGWHGGNTDLTKAIHAPFTQSETAGLPPGSEEYVHTFPANDREATETLLNEYDVGTVIVEPMLSAGGGITMNDEFLQFLHDASEERDFVLVFDEVVTGFRFSPGSYQARVGLTPDLTTLGKFLGGGLPIGALCGRADIFEAAHPNYEGNDTVLAGGGTFSMNPMTAAAGLASLEVVEREPVYDYTESQGQRVREELSEITERLGVSATILGESSLFLPHFDPDGPLETVEDVEVGTEREALQTFHWRLLNRGYYFLPGHMGSVSYQTTENQIDALLADAEAVIHEMSEDDVL